MADVENAESAEAVEVLLAHHVAVAVWACVAPFDHGACAVDFGGLAVFQKSRVDVIAEIFHRFPGDPSRLFGADGGRFYEVENLLRIFVGLGH